MDSEIVTLIEKAPRIVVGISGGRDSMALLHLLKPYYSKIFVSHVNYQTRANSELEEALVTQTCHQHQIDFSVFKAEGCSLDMPNFEAHARRVRYQFYQQCADKIEASLVLTAQHRNDLVETVFLRLLRGSNRLYIKKIRKLSPNLVLARPLLDWSRDDITKYCQTNNIPWREDESNDSTYFLRNFLRKDILPQLNNRISNLDKRLALTAIINQEENDFLDRESARIRADLGDEPHVSEWLSLESPIRRRVTALLFEENNLPSPGFHQMDEIIRKISQAKGGIILWQDKGWQWKLSKGRLIFIKMIHASS
ncbi:MAG: tRNA lysidine(34) synthetase TilS [Brevinema sp.]